MTSEQRDEPPLIEGVDELPEGLFDLPPSAVELEHRVLLKTSRVVARRRVLRRAGIAVAALLLFGAGTVTGIGLGRQTAPEAPPAVPKAAEAAQASDADEVVLDAAKLEKLLDVAAGEERAELLRRAADAHLAEQADPKVALHYYGELLKEPKERAVSVQPEDSWLLTYLKLSKHSPAKR